MIGIRYNNENLDLFPDNVIEMDLATPYFFEQQGDLIPGSYSVPFSLPLTSKNLRLLDFPNRLDNVNLHIKKERVSVYYDGIHIFYADLHIKSGGNDKISAFIIVAEFAKIEDSKLSEIDFGGVVNMGATVNDAITHANDTANNPSNYDYVFFPLKNDSFFPSGVGPTHAKSDWQNYWNQDTASFESNSNNQSAMPFLKLEFILDRIFQTQGYALDNQFQIWPGLQDICIYNNYSIYKDGSDWETSFDPANHVPDIDTKEFLKQISKIWALAITYNIFNNEATIRPAKDLLTATPSRDWSKYAQRNYEFLTGEAGFSELRFELDEADDYNYQGADRAKDRFIEGHAPDIFEYVEDLADVTLQLDKKLYYEWNNGVVHKWIDLLSVYDDRQFGIPSWKIADVTTENVLSIKGQPIDADTWNAFHGDNQVQIEGTSEHLDFHNPHAHIRWTKYHGIRTFDSKPWPFSSVHNYSGSNQIGSYAHVWPGPYGIYEQFWKPWNDFLKTSKEVTMKLYLPVHELIDFDNGEKVRILSHNYFIKRLKPKFSQGKYIETEAVLLQTN